MNDFTNAVINRKPSEFKDMVRKALAEKLSYQIQNKKAEIGASLFKEEVDDEDTSTIDVDTEETETEEENDDNE
jgi:hypothetical protein